MFTCHHYLERVAHRPFILQEKIIKHPIDLSILGWEPLIKEARSGAFAKAPFYFRDCAGIVTLSPGNEPFGVTNKRLRMRLPVIESEGDVITVLQNC